MVLVDWLTMAGPELSQGHFYCSDFLISPSQCQSVLVLQRDDFVSFIVFCVFFFFCLAVKGYLQLISNHSNKTECIKKKNLTYNLLFRYCHNRAFFFQMKSQCAKRQTNSMHCNKEIKREWQWAAGEWEKSVLDSHQRYFKRPPCQNTPQMKSH